MLRLEAIVVPDPILRPAIGLISTPTPTPTPTPVFTGLVLAPTVATAIRPLTLPIAMPMPAPTVAIAIPPPTLPIAMPMPAPTAAIAIPLPTLPIAMGSYHFYNNILSITRNPLCRLTEISVTMELSSNQ